MKKIDSQALDILNKALGLPGTGGSPITELTDGVVDQVIDVSQIIRRSRTQAATTGIYTALLRNVHTDAQSLSTLLQPYAPVPGTNRAPYPLIMPPGFEVWVLTAVLTQLSGGGTLSAALRINCPGTIMGLTTTGGAEVATMNVALWDAVVAENTTFGIASAVDQPMQRIGMRLPRAPLTQLIFSSTSSLTATFDCFVTLGVFPVALGQDVLV